MEYAKQVLAAAKQAGMKTLLATHYKCPPIHHDAIDEIRPVFLHDLWENNLSEEALSLRHCLKRAYVYLANNYPALTHALPKPLLMLFLPLAWRAWTTNQTIISHMIQSLETLSLTADDIIFVPNMGNVELAAVRHFKRKLNWHLLFRRNIFEGTETAYQAQLAHPSPRLARTVQAFTAFKHENILAHFYTDTEALTKQYSVLSGFAFHTLPIPLGTPPKRIPKAHKHPLNIVYIGDARNEKGFPLLAPLISDLRAAGYDESHVHFKIQSNFNIPGGEAATRANKRLLKNMPGAWVTLTEGPFTSAEYHAFITEADIILLPYDMQHYYARSSGIFAESLAAGIPVVTRNKSWMSQALLTKQQAYTSKLLASSAPLQTIQSNQHSYVFTPKRSNSMLIIRVDNTAALPGQYIDVKAQHADGSLIQTISLDLRIPQPLGCLRIPAVKTVSLEFSSTVPCTLFEIAGEPYNQFYAASVFSDASDFSAALREIIAHYESYEAQAIALQEAWSAQHNSHHLLKILLQNNN